MDLSRSLYSLPHYWPARAAVLAAVLATCGCAAPAGPKVLLAAGENACNVAVQDGRVSAISAAECLMQRRQAYEQALGQLSVQVLR